MLPDNRIRFSSTKIDFDTEVGNLGQDIDNYPAPGSQARFDWMRMVILGLLSNQSSLNEPTQKRDGTIWFDLNTMSFKVWTNDQWNLLSVAIPLTVDTDNNVVTLQDWFADVSSAIAGLSQELSFSGSCSANNINTITIPESLRNSLYGDSRPIVYINGLLIDPRNTRLDSVEIPTAIRLTNEFLNSGDRFSVFIKRIPNESFLIPTVSVP